MHGVGRGMEVKGSEMKGWRVKEEELLTFLVVQC
jgi:hypothetical protein